MPRILIAAFKPKPNREVELLQVIADRLPLLRKLGLATDRPNITMRAADGTILDVSEWVDQAAIDRAHELPEVHALWRRYEACCEYVNLDTLAEAHHPFATFDAVAL
jgi:quinol monooxygenase YgiN